MGVGVKVTVTRPLPLRWRHCLLGGRGEGGGMVGGIDGNGEKVEGDDLDCELCHVLLFHTHTVTHTDRHTQPHRQSRLTDIQTD